MDGNDFFWMMYVLLVLLMIAFYSATREEE